MSSFLLFICLILMTLSLPDFKVFGCAVFERKADCRTHRVETVAARCSGVDIQHPKAFIIAHTQYVAMTADENCGAQGANLGIDLAHIATTVEANVRHQNPRPLSLETLPLGVCKAHSVVVDVAIDSHHPLTEGGHLSGALFTTNIPRTPNLIDLGEEVFQWFIEGAVQVGYNTYS